MKKRRLRRWVYVAIAILFVAVLMIIDRAYTKKEINNCVNSGNEYSYCVKGLK